MIGHKEAVPDASRGQAHAASQGQSLAASQGRSPAASQGRWPIILRWANLITTAFRQWLGRDLVVSDCFVSEVRIQQAIMDLEENDFDSGSEAR